MFDSLPQPAFMPCPRCGASVPRGGQDEHVCDEEERLTYERHQIRTETDRFDTELIGGDITIQSRPQDGTRVVLRLDSAP